MEVHFAFALVGQLDEYGNLYAEVVITGNDLYV